MISSNNNNLVEIKNLNYAYPSEEHGDLRYILKGINLNIPKGKVVAIMGGSGCGKTTLLRCIGGQLKPNSGDVLVANHNVAKMSNAELYKFRRKLGMLFQFGALFTDISVFDNVAFPLREHTNLSEPMIRDLVLLKLEAVGLRGAANLMPRELSGGMARRVALARSVALDPDLIMYDEPFTGLDPIALSIIGDLIRRLNDALGATSIMVTHDVQESLEIVDYVYFLAEGKVLAEGSPEEIRKSDNIFVQQFIQSKYDLNNDKNADNKNKNKSNIFFNYAAKSLAEEFLA